MQRFSGSDTQQSPKPRSAAERLCVKEPVLAHLIEQSKCLKVNIDTNIHLTLYKALLL
jgi:hypothetical protein